MKLNLHQIFFCTGARNHDLLKFFNPEKLTFEYDERMASFKALGLSKMLNAPVGICTTSGTAVSECVSAMLEAYYSKVPLVLITGDRPKKLHGTGSPQTIEHEALTRSCRGSYFEIDLKDLETLNLDGAKFPVHINVLVDDTVPHNFELKIHQSMDGFATFLSRFKKPLFIFSHEEKSMRPLIEMFAEKKLSFYAETLSGGRDLSMIKTEKKLIELFNQGFFDSIVRIGHTPLTKIWRLLEKKPMPVFHFDSRNLPGLSFGEVLPRSSEELLNDKQFLDLIKNVLPYPVADESPWKLEELISKYPQSEISIFSRIQGKLKSDEFVYLGNSLVVRFFELTQAKKLKVFGSRGVNGIDGQLATAIGLASGTTDKVTCILGDVTTFYDLSSLRHLPSNLRLVIINNSGGRIFDMLNLDARIVLPHENNFKSICKGFNLDYSNDIEDWEKAQVIELRTDLPSSKSFLKEWNQ